LRASAQRAGARPRTRTRIENNRGQAKLSPNSKIHPAAEALKGASKQFSQWRRLFAHLFYIFCIGFNQVSLCRASQAIAREARLIFIWF